MMPADLASVAEPQFILLAWAAGLAAVAGVVALARIVGPGFTWLTSGVALVVSLVGVVSPDAWVARFGALSIVIGMIWARNRPFSGALQIAGSAFLLIAAGSLGGFLPAVSATVALGGVTGEMMLGHWYLIDPRLPRQALRLLAVAGIVGMAGDAVLLAALGLPGGGATIAFWVLMATTIVLMAAVVGSLRYPAYSGVMAATGLSYLAVLTTLGSVFLGRVLVAGLGPFGA